MATKFLLGDMVRALNCSRQLLDKWASEGVLKPTERAHGPGTRRLYTEADLARGVLLVKLANLGFNKRRLKDFQKTLRRMSEKEIRDSWIVLHQIDERGGFGPDGHGNYKIEMMKDSKEIHRRVEDDFSIVVGNAGEMIEKALRRARDPEVGSESDKAS